jgi:hypothetical protein
MDGATVEVKVGESTFRIGRLTPRKSLHVARRLVPFLGAIVPHLKGLFAPKDGHNPNSDDFFNRAAEVAPALAEIIANLEDEDVDYIVDSCLSVVQIRQERGWAPIMVNGVVMFQSLDLKTQLNLVSEVVKLNLADFFDSGQPKESEMVTTQ